MWSISLLETVCEDGLCLNHGYTWDVCDRNGLSICFLNTDVPLLMADVFTRVSTFLNEFFCHVTFKGFWWNTASRQMLVLCLTKKGSIKKYFALCLNLHLLCSVVSPSWKLIRVLGFVATLTFYMYMNKKEDVRALYAYQCKLCITQKKSFLNDQYVTGCLSRILLF